MYLQYTCFKVYIYIPFLGIQESFGEWIVFNFESSNLKQQIADVIMHNIIVHLLTCFIKSHCRKIKRVTSSFW